MNTGGGANSVGLCSSQGLHLEGLVLGLVFHCHRLEILSNF